MRISDWSSDVCSSDLLARARGVGLMVTPSRRTGPDNEAILRARLAGLPAEIWDGEGENTYFAYLGLADAILVTADSVNMVCEAASTGKPVQLINHDGGRDRQRGVKGKGAHVREKPEGGQN